MQLKSLGVKGSDNIERVAAVIKKLSTEQAAAVLSTTKLNDAQTAATLLASGLSEADAAQILVKNKLCDTEKAAIKLLQGDSVAKMLDATNTDLLTVATQRLGAAFKGIGATIKAHSILTAVTAVAAAVAIGVSLYKKYGKTQENLAKWLDESKQKVQESTQKIEEMESELEKVQSRMAELKGKDSLSVVEKKELETLEQTNAQLERSIELEKQKRRVANKEATTNLVDWFDKDLHSGLEFNYSYGDASNAVSRSEHKFLYAANILGGQGTTGYMDEATNIDLKFKKVDELLAQKESATTVEAKESIDKSLGEIFTYLSGKSDEFNEKVADLDLEYTPNAKEGSEEAKVNDIIDYIDTYNNKLLLASQKYSGAEVNYDLVFNAAIESARFVEAAKQIEKLKKTEKGAERTTEQFNKALFELINSNDYEDSNLKELIEYLQNDLGFEIDVTGEDKLMSLSEMFVKAEKTVDSATKTNLLFADSFSKIASARKAFEEGLQNVETGTEDFESYATSYEEAMKLLNQGYDLDNGVLMAHVERLISDDQLEKLGYDADNVKEYLQEHLKGVFGDKDTLEPGNGLIDKIKKYADSDGKIYGKNKYGRTDYSRELASYKDGKWHISDDAKDIEDLGKEFGMTTDQILACVKAMNTFSEVDLNDTETIIKKLEESGKVYDPDQDKKKEIEELADKYNSYTNGNVDYNKRPILEGEKVIEAGWNSDKDKGKLKGATATTYSSIYDVGKYSIDITPILENGEVLSPEALAEYIKGLAGEGSVEDLLKSDTKKLVIGVKEGSYEENEEYWENWNKNLDKIKQKHLELTEDLNGTKLAVNLKQLKEDMQSEGYSGKDIYNTIEQLKNDKNVITVEIDAKTKSKEVAAELEKLGIFSGTGTYGKGKSKWTSTYTKDIDTATEALKTFGLTGAEAYDKLKGLDIYETQKDGTTKFLTDVEKIESVIKTFNSDLDVNKYKNRNIDPNSDHEGWSVINVVPLKEELANKGYSSQFIDDYIAGLEKQDHTVAIDISMDFSQEGDAQTVEDQLVAAGVATKGKDGNYEIDVKQTVTLLKNTGASSDDVTSFLNSLKTVSDQAGNVTWKFDTNFTDIESQVTSVYTGIGNIGVAADENAQKLSSIDEVKFGNVTSQINAVKTALGYSSNNADALYRKLTNLTSKDWSVIVQYYESGVTGSPTDDNGHNGQGGPTKANGTANLSGTALAGGNWGTAVGGKTLTGELG